MSVNHRLFMRKKIVGKTVIACERKIIDGWEFCDCLELEKWMTDELHG